MRRAWRLLAFTLVLLMLLAPARAAAQESSEWRAQQTQRFNILYTIGSEQQAAFYASWVDAIYDEIAGIFGHRVATPVTLRLYASLDQYYDANPLARGMPGIVAHADYRRNEVVVLLPRTTSQTPEEVQNNVRHELTHIVASDLSGNRLNVGFQEGLAQYVERPSGELETKIRLLRRAAETDRLLSWSDLDSREQVYGSPEVGYPQSLSIVAFLVERYSFAKMREFLEVTARSSGYRSALQRTYGVAPDELERAWRDWLPTYLDGGYARNALTAYDLAPVEGLLANGRYSEARRELETAIAWLQQTDQADALARAQELLAVSQAGEQADAVARQAREALDAFDYLLAAELAAQAEMLYVDLQDARQAEVLQAYTARAERGRSATQTLAQATALAVDWRSYPQARAAADRAAADLLALGDRERADAALALRTRLDEQQRLLGAALLVVGVLGVAANLFRRIGRREAEAW